MLKARSWKNYILLALSRRYFRSSVNSYNKTESFKFNFKYAKFPERFKGTVVEKWADYWKNLINDYVDVGKDTVTSAKKQPTKTAVLLSLFGTGVFCFKNNPDEVSYRDAVISCATELIFVGPSIRNPKVVEYLKEIEKGYNNGTIHRISLGFMSLIVKEDYNNCLGIYKANCKYLEVPFYRFYEKIIDVGFLNRWIYLEKTMVDYDINPQEWQNIESN